jgi:peptidoglycan hydrolase-like protein with peptidoglycan-binding domain
MPATEISPFPLVLRGNRVFPVRGEGPPIHVDGIFGPQTDNFVRGFQTALGISADGIVGPVTWRALVSGMLSG